MSSEAWPSRGEVSSCSCAVRQPKHASGTSQGLIYQTDPSDSGIDPAISGSRSVLFDEDTRNRGFKQRWLTLRGKVVGGSRAAVRIWRGTGQAAL